MFELHLKPFVILRLLMSRKLEIFKSYLTKNLVNELPHISLIIFLILVCTYLFAYPIILNYWKVSKFSQILWKVSTLDEFILPNFEKMKPNKRFTWNLWPISNKLLHFCIYWFSLNWEDTQSSKHSRHSRQGKIIKIK